MDSKQDLWTIGIDGDVSAQIKLGCGTKYMPFWYVSKPLTSRED